MTLYPIVSQRLAGFRSMLSPLASSINAFVDGFAEVHQSLVKTEQQERLFRFFGF